MRDRVLEILIKAKDLTATAFGRFQRNLLGIERTVRNVGRSLLTVTKYVTGFAAAAVASIVGLVKFGEQGDKVIAVGAAFAKMAGNQAEALDRLREASRGTVSDFQLMALHNQALALGAADTTEQFAEMIELSRTLGRAQGIDALRALESLTTGLGRQSKQFLDNLGILLDVEKVYSDYAKSLNKTADQLTDTQKRTAFMAAAMDQARAKAATMAVETGKGAEAGARLATAFTNAKDKLSEFVAQSPMVATFLDGVAGVVTGIVDIITSDRDLIERAFREVGTIAGNAFSIAVKESVEATRGFLAEVAETLIPERFKVSKEAAEAIGRTTDKKVGDDILARSLEESANLAKENIKVAVGVLDEIAKEAARRAAERQAATGVVGGGGTSAGTTATNWLDPSLVSGAGIGGVSASSSNPLVWGQSPLDRANRARLFAQSQIAEGTKRLGEGIGDQADHLGFTGGLSEAAKDFSEAGEVAAATLFGLGQAVVRGTDDIASSVINMITQILQSLPGVGGIAGVLIGGVGGILGALVSKRDPTPVKIEEYGSRAEDQMRKTQGPLYVTSNLVLPDGTLLSVEQAEIQLADRANRDETIRYGRSGRAILGGR